MARWLPGQSGNPHGRPRRGQALTDAILRFSRQKIAVGEDDDEPTTMQRRDALALLLWQRALAGDLTAARIIIEYMQGKPVQPVQAAIGVTPLVPFTADEAGAAAAEIAAWSLARTAQDDEDDDEED